MLKAKMADGLVLLGLEAQNIKRLLEGKPIVLNLQEIGLPERQIMIFYGATIEDMKAELARAGVHLREPS